MLRLYIYNIYVINIEIPITGGTPSCAKLQTQDLSLTACSLERCSEWCQHEFGRSVGALKFGCQIVEGIEALAFCECSEGGRGDADLERVVLCHEPLACSMCDHGFCSTSPEKNKLFNSACVACEPGFVLLPTGDCAVLDPLVHSCPKNNPCLNGGWCIDGNPTEQAAYFCACKPGFGGPLCNAGLDSKCFAFVYKRIYNNFVTVRGFRLYKFLPVGQSL